MQDGTPTLKAVCLRRQRVGAKPAPRCTPMETTESERSGADAEQVQVRFAGGQSFSLSMPAPHCGPSCFTFSQHKSGSSLLTGMLHLYCRKLHVDFLDVPMRCWDEGAKLDEMTPESARQLFRANGHCYWGWREYPIFLDQCGILHSTRNIFLVRDPRDRLVSLYFSLAYSHELPATGSERQIILHGREEALGSRLDEAAIQYVKWIKDPWWLYHRNLPGATTRIYRYEDVIFRKAEWLSDIIGFFDLPRDEAIAGEIAASYDIRPEKENPSAHIRQVLPGNHRKHMCLATIEQLNKHLAAYLRRYDYFRPEAFGRSLVFACQGEEAERVLAPILDDNSPLLVAEPCGNDVPAIVPSGR